MKRKKKLTNLTIEEVSLVDKGANPGANILIFKRDDEMENKETNTEVDAEVKLEDEKQVSKEDTNNETETKEENSAEEVTEEKEVEVKEEEKSVDETDTEDEVVDVEKAVNAFEASIIATETLDDLWDLTDSLRSAIKTVFMSEKDDKDEQITNVLQSFVDAVKSKTDEALVQVGSMQKSFSNKEKEVELLLSLDKDTINYYKNLDDKTKDEILEQENSSEELEKRAKDDVVLMEGDTAILKSVVGELAFGIIKKSQEEKAETEAKLQEEINKRLEEEMIKKANALLEIYPLDGEEKLSIYKAMTSMDKNAQDSLSKLFSAGKSAFEGLTEIKALPVEKASPKEESEQEKTLKCINKN